MLARRGAAALTWRKRCGPRPGRGPPVSGHDGAMHTDVLPLPADILTLDAMLRWRAAATPQGAAYLRHDPERGAWEPVTWADALQLVARRVAALRALALPPHARIAILLPNGLEAVCIDQAALALGFVPVPMHSIDNPASIAYILADSEASVLVADTEAQWRAIAGTGVPLPSLRLVCVSSGNGAVEGGAGTGAVEDRAGPVPLRSVDEWLSAVPDAGALPPPPTPPEPDDLAAVVYTSGTTGKPKGVMLTHANVVSNVRAVIQRVAPRSSDVFLSFLPLSHTFERTAGYYLPIAVGACVAHARSVALLQEDLRTVRPTVLVSVPRIYERVHAALQGVLATSALKHGLFVRAEAVGWRRFRRAQSLPIDGPAGRPWLDAITWLLLEPLVARPLLARFGGRLRVAVSGGAPLSGTIARCFLGLGLPLVQGYGMTETSPVVAANAPQDNDPATVGRPLAGVEVRIAGDRELQVRGPGVMRGYWKRPEDTQRAFDDGWLRTGDQAAIEDGRVRILGRLKEIIVTSTGEKVAPVDVELAITADARFEQAWVFGDNRPFVGCVVLLERRAWARWAAELGLDPESPDALASEAARGAVLARVQELTRGFPRPGQPRSVWLTLDPWTTESGLMTPTLKLKRNNLAARFAERIETMYKR